MARRKKGRDISGWLVVDKPAGPTSTTVVNKVRWALDAKKAGHAGTLDPAATGVLAVALGEATKTVPFITDALKCYRFEVRFGQATNTDDAEGEVIDSSDARPSDEQIANLVNAIRDGVGLAGSHGGMGDAFRGKLDYEWMVGGHFVGHPHVGDYEVRVTEAGQRDPIMQDAPTSFLYNSEQYYMMMDPAVEVLAETTYLYEDSNCIMPVVWKRNWGKGHVFYSALGHHMQEFTDHPHVLDLTIKGLLWATRA